MNAEAKREERKKAREERKKERESSRKEDESKDDASKDESEDEIVFVYAENQVDGFPTVISAYRFRDEVEKATNGRIKIDVQVNSAVGSEEEVLKMLQDGAEFNGEKVAFMRSSLAPLITSTGYTKLNVVQLPYLYRDKEHMRDVLNSDIGEVFLNELAENDTGLRGLTWTDAGARNFYNSKREIKSADDMKGLKLRVQNNEMMLEMIELLGVDGVTAPYEELGKLLENGDIDGAENNWASYVSQEHYKSAPYYCLDEHVRIPEMIVISDEIWNSLSEEDQDIIKRCAKLSAETEWDEWAKGEEKYEKLAKENGCIITEIKDKSSFQEKIAPLYDKYAGDYMDIVKEIQEYGK